MGITFYYPSERFPTISVTGDRCNLNCLHCEGKFLGHMIAVEPSKLYEFCSKLEKEGSRGCLISGGFDSFGKVPLPYDGILKVKKKTNLMLNVHTGIVEKEDVLKIKESKIDCVSFDFVWDDEIISKVFGLNRTKEDYLKSLKLLKGLDINVVPHLCIGLNFGKVQKEFEALMILKELGFEKVVLIIFKSRKGTAMEDVPLDVSKVLEVLKFSRENFKKVILGCMRPRIGELEEFALCFDGIVAPSKSLREKALKLSLDVEEKYLCCVF
ncbi:MAG: radical SAM protein [Candidatus Methanofastidiosia archaeon]